ncbi:MAG: baseplate J/gp47 family protein [Desulfobulbaceae bacterium]|nr:baseplate J/gp47 family protein [Desulfobulbaceae bacterium]
MSDYQTLPTFDELLDQILTDYRNLLDESVDTSEGSLVFIRSAVLAAAAWGILRHQEHIAKQIFPDTATEQNLEHHGWLRAIDRKQGESAADYLGRVLDNLRQPPAGGNRYDYVKWAKEITNVTRAYSYPLAQGAESVDVVILADEAATGSEIPTQELLDEVAAYIDDVRPVGARYVRVLAPTVEPQDVTMTVYGSGVDTAEIQADIEAYLDTFEPDQKLYLSQLVTIASNGGAENAEVSVPAATVTPQPYGMLRPGVISVNAG